MISLPKLKEQIDQRETNNIYVFTGEETVIRSIYIEKIAKATNTKLTRIDAISQVFSKLKSNAMFDVESCYVVYDDRDYLKQEKVWQKLLSEKAQGKNTVIFVYEKLDKRSKFYKAHTDVIVEFEKLSIDVLVKHTKKETELSDVSARQLVTMCGMDYGRIMTECSKLNTLAKASKTHIEKAFTQAQNENLIYQPPEEVIFNFIEMVLRRNFSKLFFNLKQLVEKEENPLAIISLLYSNFRSVLLVQSAGSSNNLTASTGLTAWQIKMAKEKQGYYSVGELVHAVKTIRSVEKAIKTGDIESKIAIDYLLINVL